MCGEPSTITNHKEATLKKYIWMVPLILGLAISSLNAQGTDYGSSYSVVFDTSCNKTAYYNSSVLCVDTSENAFYRGTGTGIQAVAAGTVGPGTAGKPVVFGAGGTTAIDATNLNDVAYQPVLPTCSSGQYYLKSGSTIVCAANMAVDTSGNTNYYDASGNVVFTVYADGTVSGSCNDASTCFTTIKQATVDYGCATNPSGSWKRYFDPSGNEALCYGSTIWRYVSPVVLEVSGGKSLNDASGAAYLRSMSFLVTHTTISADASDMLKATPEKGFAALFTTAVDASFNWGVFSSDTSANVYVKDSSNNLTACDGAYFTESRKGMAIGVYTQSIDGTNYVYVAHEVATVGDKRLTCKP